MMPMSLGNELFSPANGRLPHFPRQLKGQLSAAVYDKESRKFLQAEAYLMVIAVASRAK